LLPHVLDERTAGNTAGISITVSLPADSENVLASGLVSSTNFQQNNDADNPLWVPFNPALTLEKDQVYMVGFHLINGAEEVGLCGEMSLTVQTENENRVISIPEPADCSLTGEMPHIVSFSVPEQGVLLGVTLPSLQVRSTFVPQEQVLTLSLKSVEQGGNTGEGSVLSDFSGKLDPRGDSFRVRLHPAVRLEKGKHYLLEIALPQGEGSLKLQGSAIANESTWDDGLPLRMDGYDPFGGIYQGGLNFEMYWDDNGDKLERFVDTLNDADVILITSSRQWASTTRLPKRYPLTSAYYRYLAGCPAGQSIEVCYNLLEPGDDHGRLGFKLTKVFQSSPRIGALKINDQFSEEAFTVYDHPKVFVFTKADAYSREEVRKLLSAVDLSEVVHVTPKKAGTYPEDLKLPPDRLAEQQAGGTWSSLFDWQNPFNTHPILGAILWYVALSVLGFAVYPIMRYAFSGLSDRAFPLARIFGLVLLAWMSWFAGSVGLTFSRLTIGMAYCIILIVGILFAYHQRDEIKKEWQTNWRYFLAVEGLFLVFLVFGLLVRYGNPDLWHPWKGGEKPMDFSYFNAVLKSTSFPPYDPWFAGGYINYYYYGFVIVGVLVKLLGIVPAIAYNLIVPTLFAMTAMGAFSIVWNLITTRKLTDAFPSPFRVFKKEFLGGLVGAVMMALAGNLGIWQMIYRGFQVLGAPSGQADKLGFLQQIYYGALGAVKVASGAQLPYRMDEWYWNPSRVIGAAHGSPITEFPFFTFLYADLHAHMIAMPVAMLIIAWGLSVVKGRAWEEHGKRSLYQVVFGLFAGGLAIGATYPVNLSDSYTYYLFGILLLGYAVFRYWDVKDWKLFPMFSLWTKRLIHAGLWSFVLVAFARLLYLPYSIWYAQGYSKIALWTGSHTPVGEYFTHWGLFLFFVISWMFYETIDWMAVTPVSALRKLKPYRQVILLGVFFLLLIVFALGIHLQGGDGQEISVPIGLGIGTAWFIIPVTAWALVLMLRPSQDIRKQFVLFLIATALMLTLAVEIVVVQGDIGRMNTVFKFYLQAWVMLSVSAAASCYWLFRSMKRWPAGAGFFWNIGWVLLAGIALMYPILGTMAKVRDRMAPNAPHTLDGMRYMQSATYFDLDTQMNLKEDYDAIRWMQEYVIGSPVIVEANMVEYHWGTRFTIYTGLPGVIGWNWHQRQQRAVTPQEWVFNRIGEVEGFYRTTNLDQAKLFLKKYNVHYIILGQLERAKYAGDGLDKFEEQDGILWRLVYQTGETAIYEVLPPGRMGD